MNLFIHLLIILLNIYSIVFLFLLIQKIFSTKKTTLHLLITSLVVFICFTVSTFFTPKLRHSLSSEKSIHHEFSIDPLCQVELFVIPTVSERDSTLTLTSHLSGVIAGLQWQENSIETLQANSNLHYQVKGEVKYLILGFPFLSKDQIFSGMIKFDELKKYKESSTKWNTSTNSNSQSNLIQKMY